jgi:hypothetical protein
LSALEKSKGFWQLSERGFVSLRRTGYERVELVGGKYVGRARVGEVELRIREKVAGTVSSLIGAASGGELRIEPAASPATEFDAVSRHLLKQFVQAAGRYIADRRRPRYRYHQASGAVLAGRLDMPATMKLHATGRLSQFAFQRGEVVRDEPVDRLVLGALDELDRAALVLKLDPDTVYQARWLARALEEIRTSDFLQLGSAGLLAIAEGIELDDAVLPADLDLARLSAVALLHQGFELDRAVSGEVPRAWFVDLESLFERAVRLTLNRLVIDAKVDKGLGFERRMFTGGADGSRVYPDLVVHSGVRVEAVGDVKYKTLDSSENGSIKKGNRSDLYQLLVHAASFSCNRAFLVYASGSGYSKSYLGCSATGCHIWTAQVRPTDLDADLRRLLDEIGLHAIS